MNKNHYKFVYSALIDSLNKASKYGKLNSTKITILNFLNDVFTNCNLNITQKNSKQLENLYYKLLRDLRQRCPNCYKNDIKVITKYTPDNKPPFLINAKKVWEDNNNSKDVRPEDIEVQVWAGDVLYGDAVLNEENNWKYTFEGLNEKNPDTNQLIDYYINETDAGEYYISEVVKEVKTFSNDFLITNTLTLEPSIYTEVVTFDLNDEPILNKIIPYEGGIIVDSIYYSGLDINQEYTITCKIINKNTTEDTNLEFTKNFIPTNHNGIEEISFTLSEEMVEDLENGEYVIFTYLYLNNNLIINHTDLNDELETFLVQKIICEDLELEFDVSADGPTHAAVTINPTKGVSPYTYLWDTGATTQTVTGLNRADEYTVTVTDANNCSTTEKVIPLHRVIQGLKLQMMYFELNPNNSVDDPYYPRLCTGGHICNRARFEIFANNVSIGIANLNNNGGTSIPDGTIDDENRPPDYPNYLGYHTRDRYWELNITTETAEMIMDPDTGIIDFDCVYTGIDNNPHSSASWFKITKQNGTVLSSECISTSTGFTFDPFA